MSAKATLSAGVIPFFRRADAVWYLILRSYNYWDFPKGEVESGEDPLSCARRELLEETGLSQVEFPFASEFYETEAYAKNKVARYYLGEVFSQDVHLGINPELGRPEHNEYRWVRAAEAEKLLGARVRQALHWALRLRV